MNTDPSTDDVLIAGIRRWLNENQRRYRRTELAAVDFDELAFTNGAKAAARRLVDAGMGVTLGAIKALGKDAFAYALGCNIRGSIGYARVCGSTHQPIRCYSWPVFEHAYVDGVHKSSVVGDDAARYKSIAEWRNNSCAYSAVLFVAIMMEVGRSRYDQITTTDKLRLSKPTAVFRGLLCQPLARFDGKTMAQLRDHVRGQLHAAFPKEFTLADYDSLHKVYEKLLEACPTVSFVIADTRVCCDGIPHVTITDTGDTLSRLTEHNTLVLLQSVLDSRTVGEHIKSYFGPREPRVPSPQLNCTNGDRCTRKHSSRRVIVDRLPPYLTFIMPTAITQGKHAHLFDAFEFEAINAKGEDATRLFVACGIVFLLSYSHYVSRWLRSDGLYHYDDLRSSTVTVITRRVRVDKVDWLQGMASDAQIAMVFYKMGA